MLLSLLLLCLTKTLWGQECESWLERATEASAPISLQFRPGTNATGNMFLHSQGIQLSLVERKGGNRSLQGGGAFEIEV